MSAELIVAKQCQRHASMRAAWRYGTGCFFGRVRLAPDLAGRPLSPDAELTRRQTTSDHAAPRCFAMHARRLILAHHGMPDTSNAPCLLLLTPTRGNFAVTRHTSVPYHAGASASARGRCSACAVRAVLCPAYVQPLAPLRHKTCDRHETKGSTGNKDLSGSPDMQYRHSVVLWHAVYWRRRWARAVPVGVMR